jgi:hypothetical protein
MPSGVCKGEQRGEHVLCQVSNAQIEPSESNGGDTQ